MTLVNPLSTPHSVDWTLAGRLAGRLVGPGPVVGRAEGEELVSGLHAAVHRARDLAQEAAQLSTANLPHVSVVDRSQWSRVNARLMANFMAIRPELGLPGDTADMRGPHLGSTAEVALALAMLSSRVVGQYDPYTRDSGSGVVMMVAPNVLRLERVLGVNPQDLRLWLAVHEQTHAIQFAIAPWLGEMLRSLIRDVASDIVGGAAESEGALNPPWSAIVRAMSQAFQGDDTAMINIMLTDAQRSRMGQITGIMALLEGHADVVMDAVRPAAIPSMSQLRKALSVHRERGVTGVTGLLFRRVLGFGVKLAQYRDGAAFVRQVQHQVGTDGLNAIWSAPDNLPSMDEIAAPSVWVRRIHG